MINQFVIKRIKMRNFLCFGDDGVEIDFEQKSNIILVRGRNEDIPEDNEEERIASNGVGKSSIAEGIIYGLTGLTIRKFPKAENIINNKSSNSTMELQLWVDDLRIVRTRKGKTASLRVYQIVDGKEVDKTCGTMKDSQTWINDKFKIQSVLALINLLVFTDNNSGSFLESDAEDRRNQAETNFNLSVYANYHDSSNKLLTKVKNEIKYLTTELSACEKNVTRAEMNLDRAKSQDLDWKKLKQSELQALIATYNIKEKEIATSDVGIALLRYEEAQEKIKQLTDSVALKDTELNSVKEKLAECRKGIENFQTSKNNLSLEIQQIKSNIISAKSKVLEHKNVLDNMETKRCPKCLQLPIDNEDELKLHYQKLIDIENNKISKLNDMLLIKESESDKFADLILKTRSFNEEFEIQFRNLNTFVDSSRREISILSKIEKPEISLNEKLLQNQLDDLRDKILNKKTEFDGPSPYVENIKNANEELVERKKELDEKKNDLNEISQSVQLYEFWRKAFGDSGIRKFVIDGIIPILNERIFYWLKFLIDNRLTLEFDSSLNEKIERNPPDGDAFVYSAMSGGERRRLNLAVAASMAYVTSTMTGTCPSLIFLDEVTTNIDPIGVQGVYNMIIELANEKKVIVTTHDTTLQRMLENYDSIDLVKKDGISRIEISN